MAPLVDVLWYGDQSVDSNASLQRLLRECPSSPPLRTFLQESWKRLSTEVAKLPLSDQGPFRHEGFQRLSTANLGVGNAAVSCVLDCVNQIGWTIRYRECFQATRGDERPLVTGVCTGTLAALVAGAAVSQNDLLVMGPDMVLVALRLGIEVVHRSTCIDASPGSWTAMISNIPQQTVHEHLQSFHETQKTPAHQRLYISGRSSNTLSLSGPPSLLRIFLASDCLRHARITSVPVAGAYHADHLPMPNLTSLIPHPDIWNRTWRDDQPIPWLDDDATSKCSSNVHDLLRTTLQNILQTPVNPETSIKKVEAHLSAQPVRFVKIGPSYLSNMIQAIPQSTVIEFGLDREASGEKSSGMDGQSIAIVGMAGKFPEAENPDELWNILLQGLDLHREIPSTRFDVKTHYDPTGKVPNTTLTPYGCFYDNMDAFDLAMFRMSPREAAQTDPMQRLMLITAYEALENAGYYDSGDSTTRPKIGTFYGQGGDDYRQCNSSQDIDTNYITGGIRAFGPGRVSYHFGWSGPSMTVDTACSASAVAVHQACSSLWLRECDMALAGGANLLTCSDMFAGLSRASFLSPTGSCKTLDENADGYCRAESVATVVLKRLDQALEENDNILGVIRSIKTNHAPEAVSITHPHAGAQTALFQSVLDSAGVSIDDVDHVEMHGTGTQAGDVAETTSIASLLSKPRPSHHPLYLGAVKPNVGHSEAASGVTSLIKGLLMMRHHIVPRHIGIHTRINPNIPDLDALNIQVPLEHKEIKSRPGSTRKMLVNNFNATGGSTALLLEEYHQKPPPNQDPRAQHPIVLSAATPTSLMRSIENLMGHIEIHQDLDPSDLSYTLTARRMHHGYRFACVASDTKSLYHDLKKQVSKTSPEKCSKELSIVFVFTGQASQYAGMGAHLFETCAVFRHHLIASDALCKSLGMQSFISLITDSDLDVSTEAPVKCQLALVALELALAHMLQTWGVHPAAVVGHSLGEYSALCVAGVISRADTFFLVAERALAMQRNCSQGQYAMLAVATSAEEAEQRLASSEAVKCEVACMNSPTQTVVSGPIDELEHLKSVYQSSGTKAEVIQTAFAFHSAQMDAIIPEIQQLAGKVQFHRPQIPVGSTCLGRVVDEDGILGAEYLRRQTREPVRFQQALETLSSKLNPDTTLLLELGPASTCVPMIVSTLKHDRVASILSPKIPNWGSVANALAKVYQCGGDPRWDEYHKEYLNALSLVQLPAYPFDMTSHWINYEGAWQITKNQGQDIKAPASCEMTQSITLHRLESDISEGGVRKLLFSADLTRQDLQDLISAHGFQDISMCSATVYAEMALAAARHVWGVSRSKLPSIHISALQIEEQLQLDPGASNTILLDLSQDSGEENNLKVKISKDGIDYARCIIARESYQPWVSDLEKVAYLFESRMALLDLNATLGTSVKHQQSAIYSTLMSEIKVDPSFQCIEEAVFDQNSLEGQIVAVIEDLKFKAIENRVKSLAYPEIMRSSPLAFEIGSERTRDPITSPESLSSEQITQPPTPNPVPSSGADNFSNVVDLIASETGINPQAITDDSLLDDLGVDSLMQISIVGKLRETVSSDVPSSLLMECNRVSNLRDFFQEQNIE